MTPDALIQALASELKDVLRTLDEDHLRENHEEELVNLAARLVLKLNRKAITIIPIPSRAERIQRGEAEAAQRIFDVLSTWMNKHPECSLVTEKGISGKFGIVVRTPGATQAFFQGESIQDAYAQAAQAISFEEET